MSKSSHFSNNKRKIRFTKGEQNKKFQPSNRKSNFQNPTRSFARFRLFIEYDGTRYSGWQKQENAKTIQGTLIHSAMEIFGNDFIDLQGSGRTDSGVHALEQVAHLDVKTVLAPEIIRMKLNDILPSEYLYLKVRCHLISF